jgi:hypothetical protein
MAQYKVIQDIEAEDRLLGPLTLKGFIYAIIAVFCGFINFRLIAAGLGPIKWLLVLVFAGPMILFGVLASPLGRQQPTEVWLLARIRFLIKGRKRLWSQSGLQHLVTITVPKKIERNRTKGLSETEVKSRLQTLATTLDSRGWAVRNVTVAPALLEREQESDRLVAPTTLSSPSTALDVHPADDIMDEQSNPNAQRLAGLMEQADADRGWERGVRLRLAADLQPRVVQRRGVPQVAALGRVHRVPHPVVVLAVEDEPDRQDLQAAELSDLYRDDFARHIELRDVPPLVSDVAQHLLLEGVRRGDRCGGRR